MPLLGGLLLALSGGAALIGMGAGAALFLVVAGLFLLVYPLAAFGFVRGLIYQVMTVAGFVFLNSALPGGPGIWLAAIGWMIMTAIFEGVCDKTSEGQSSDSEAASAQHQD